MYKVLDMNKEIINRPRYTQHIEQFLGNDLIKVFIGQRRSGKSSLLQYFQTILTKKHKISPEDIIFISTEFTEWSGIRDWQTLYRAIEGKRYVFLDEVQEIPEWERAVRDLQARGESEIFLSGSNSTLLASELTTFLAGRYISFSIFPLSYSEFLQFHKQTANKESFDLYYRYGGLPYLPNLPLIDNVIFPYLHDVFDTIVLKDIVARYKVRNIAFFQQLIRYLAQHVGSIFSAKSISDFLKSQGIQTSPTVILEYLEHAKQALFLHEVPRYDIKGKKIFEVRQKYFFTDIGLRNTIVGGFSRLDISGILENVVFIHLRATGWDVKIGEISGKEIDFVAEKSGKTIYIQVAYLLESQETMNREFSALQAIKDSWPKYVLSMDTGRSTHSSGIIQQEIWQFLLDLEKDLL